MFFGINKIGNMEESLLLNLSRLAINNGERQKSLVKTQRLKNLKLFVFIFFIANLLSAQPSQDEKIYGMLIGSAIGDAAGGPVEFVYPPQRSYWTTTDKKITAEGIKELGKLFKLRKYPKNAEPFAQWEPYGPAGTITDDTRFKMIFFNALHYHNGELTLNNFASEVLQFRERIQEKYKPWYDKWIPEIAFATNWVLGKRENAYPTARIWGGIPTMEGQMPFLPIAALNPDDLNWVYIKTWELGYFDNGVAKDQNSALLAGIARGLQPDGSWENVEKAMRETDPYAFNKVLYVPRRLDEWLDKAHQFVQRSDGNIASLFRILEKDIETRTWWESWVPIVVVFSCAEIVNYDPMAAMELMMEFGHDTDSFAQVMGAIIGAIHGKDIFPAEMRKTVNEQMKIQFKQNVDDWVKIIQTYKLK